MTKKVTWQDVKDSWKLESIRNDKSLHYMLKHILIWGILIWSFAGTFLYVVLNK